MGAIYRAIDDSLDLQVAVKMLNPRLAEDKEILKRFEREARSAAKLQHPNIAHVFYSGRHKGLPFFVMEYVDGVPVSEIIEKRYRVTGGKMIEIIRNVATALSYAEQFGIIHRDIKPSNIMLTSRTETVKLVDFGLAKDIHDQTDITLTGYTIGTPNYLAPELGRGKTADFRSDMYALGVTFFELLV